MDDRLLVVKIAAWLEAHLADARSKDVIEISGYSETRLRQKFYSVTGETPAAYLRKRRLSEAAREIMAGARIADTALKYGYSSQDNFTTAFRTWFGVTPGELQAMDRAYRGFIERLKEPLNIMQIENLAQPSLDTTLMGCMKGAADYFDLDWSAPMLFGLSGHAFLINIHREVCPSSPYVWNHQRFYGRMERLGVRHARELELRKGAAAADIRDVEDTVKAHLNGGGICLLDYLEHQLVSGYDDKGFVFLKPWNGMAPSEVQSLSFGTLGECLDKEGWVHFTLLDKGVPSADFAGELRESLALALDLHARPELVECEGYRAGGHAWETWINAVKAGAGTSHGHWWNATVWSECRRMAADFFSEVGTRLRRAEVEQACAALTALYREAAGLIAAAREKALETARQVEALSAAQRLEEECQAGIRKLQAVL